MQINWTLNRDLSAMHAAWCITHFPEATSHCSGALRTSATEISDLASTFLTAETRFWETILTLTIDGERNAELASRLILRLLGNAKRPPEVASETAARVTRLEQAFQLAYPKYQEEIVLRAEPLKQLWEAHGPGLLFQIGRLTSPELLVESASIVLVQPILGGAGYAHLQFNRAHLEAVLTNSDPRLPETLRVAWLLSQLDFERPVHSELINSHDIRRIAGFAMIPPTLIAGAELGLCEYSLQSVELAIQLWHADLLCHRSESPPVAALSQVLMTWWETYEVGKPEWRIALTGLDRMLP